MTTSQTFGRWLAWLANARLFWVLLVLNLLVTLAVVAVSFQTLAGDHFTYLGYAEGLARGRYTYWFAFPEYVPDTLRNPGYPLFLYWLKLLGLGQGGARLVQAGLYLLTIWLLLKVAARCEAERSHLVRNLFLLLLLPNFQVAYFAAIIYPELLVTFVLAGYGAAAVLLPLGSWKRTLALAVLAGLIFQIRPVFIFFPLAQLALDFWHTRPKAAFSWVQAGALLVVFGATMVPYTIWNYQQHGVAKITSLEGGAGVMQIGFWALRMPGYREERYWGNRMGDEVVSFADSAAVPGYIAAFNREWDAIDAQTRPLLTASDLRHEPAMLRGRDERGLFPLYSSAYTQRREQLLMQANLANIRREPGYYFKTRLYTLVRLWVTGVQRPIWRAATTPIAKLKVLYPTLSSGFTFVLALLLAGWALIARPRVRLSYVWQLSLLLVVYFGLIHLPFAIQARYTVPVRPWLLLGMALAAAAWLSRRAPAAGPAAS